MKKSVIWILVGVGLFLVLCTCVGVAVSIPVAKKVISSAIATAEANNGVPAPPPGPVGPYTTPENGDGWPVPTPTPPTSFSGEGHKIIAFEITTAVSKPDKYASWFIYTVTLTNKGNVPLGICAINFRGDVAKLVDYKPAVSPKGEPYYIRSAGVLTDAGVNYKPCVTIPVDKKQDFVFQMIGYMEHPTMGGEIGMCGNSIPSVNGEKATDDCIYEPIEITVP